MEKFVSVWINVIREAIHLILPLVEHQLVKID